MPVDSSRLGIPVCSLFPLLLLLAHATSAQVDTQTLGLGATKDLAYDEVRGRLYVAAARRGEQNFASANTVFSIDPVSGTVVDSLVLGGSLTQVALSSDGNTLYVARKEANSAIVRIDLAAWIATVAVAFPGAADPYTFAVAPGKPETLAVVRVASNREPDRLEIWRDGVRLVDRIETRVTTIGFGDVPGRLYGLSAGSGFLDLARYEVSDTGVRLLSSDAIGIGGNSGSPYLQNGKVYLSDGTVVDGEDRTVVAGGLPAPLGLNGSAPWIHTVARSPSAGRLLALHVESYGALLTAYDESTREEIASVQLLINGFPVSRLVRWGDRGLAYATNGQLVLVTTDLAAQPIAGLVTSIFNPYDGVWRKQSEYDPIVIEDTLRLPVRVVNTGNAALRVDSTTATASALTFSPATFTLPPGDSLFGTLTYAPARTGSFSERLTFASNAAGLPRTFKVAANFFGSILELDRGKISWQTVNLADTTSLGFQIANRSTRAVDVMDIESADTTFAVSPRAFTIPPFGSKWVTVTLLPLAPGTFRGDLIIRSTAFVSTDTIRVEATLVREARPALSTFQVGFEDVRTGQTVDSTIRFSNTGSDTLRVASNTAVAPFSITPQAFTLAPGESTQLLVTATPDASTPDFVGLSIYFDGPSNRLDGRLLVYLSRSQSTSADPAPLITEEIRGVHPNPARDAAWIDLATPHRERATLTIYDVMGRAVRTEAVDLSGGEQRLRVPLVGLPSGTYVLRLTSPSFAASRTLSVAS